MDYVIVRRIYIPHSSDKTLTYYVKIKRKKEFTFHIVQIKLATHHPLNLARGIFTFHIVQIKLTCISEKQTYFSIIYIPHSSDKTLKEN